MIGKSALGSPLREICTMGSERGDEYKRLRPVGEGTGSKESEYSEAPQRATTSRLVPTHQEDFLGFSYGFRPGRGQHDALDALAVGITQTPVNWIVDVDVRAFFDTVSHEWLIRFVEHRIADTRMLRLIRKWLKAGVMDDGEWRSSEAGTPQGAVVSPTLANIYLHYAFDQWAERWRHHEAHGNVIYVRYADDIVAGFEHESDAVRFLAELRERLEKFALSLHPDKTRLIEFGRHAADDRKNRGLGKPETFNFLALRDCLWVKAASS
jgi:group II intron reverse transcriptase/maturase